MAKMDLDVIDLGGSKYISGTALAGTLSRIPRFQCGESQTRIPVTVINVVDAKPASLDWIRSRLDELELMDDVISASFTTNVIIKASGSDSESFLNEAASAGHHLESAGETPCDGPYLLDGERLYKAYRLYEDRYNAFVCGVVQSEEEPFSFKQVEEKEYIPVPSRCYYALPNKQKPLSGKRIAVKDIYDLCGVPTAAGCKGYGVHHGPAKNTAECVKSLLDQGAVIVAKAKTVQFASGMASADWTADICPTNPRGDGQLDTDCSSSGSAAAVAGYEWLDFAVGSDSLGSMTGPASACGVFGLRPSVDALSNVGAVPVSTHLDTPGHFSRSITELSEMAAAWLRPLLKENPEPLGKKPTAIIVLQEGQISHIDSKILAMRQFVQDLEAYCGVSHIFVSIEDLWLQDLERPSDSPSLSQYLHNTVAHIQLHDCWKNASQFLGEYSEERCGKLEIDPLIRYKWKETFRQFLGRSIFVDRTVVVLPGGDPDIHFRDEKTPDEQYNTWQGFGLQNTTYSVLGGLPAVSVPVGQRPYHSKLTGKMANQPISVMVLGPRGSDIWLLQHLEKALGEVRGLVRCGSDAF